MGYMHDCIIWGKIFPTSIAGFYTVLTYIAFKDPLGYPLYR